MRIQNNIMAMNTHRMYTVNNNNVSKSAEKLSSGYRINRAGDDAAGLAISEKMRAQIRGLNMASKNSQDAVSLVQTAEGALQEVHSMLQRMNELAVQSASGTNDTGVDRAALQQEFQNLQDEIDQIADTTTFNDMKLLDGSLGGGKVAFTDTVPQDAVAAVYELDLTGGTAGKVTLDGIEQDFDTDIATTAQKFVKKYNAADSKAYTASVSGNKIVLTAKEAGAVATAPTATALTGQTTTAVAEATVGADPTVGTAPSITIDYNNVNMNTGDTVTIDGKVYMFNTGNTDISNILNGATEVKLTFTEDMTEAQKAEHVATQLANATGATTAGNGFTVAAAGGKVTITDPAAQGAALDTVKLTEESVSVTGGIRIQTGAEEGQTLTFRIQAMNTVGLKVHSSDVSIATQDEASKAITATRTAINTVSTQRAELGAMQNRLEHKISNLDNTAENLSAAESRIRDVDMAKEMTNFTKNNILSQAATAMLAQANAAPQGVLSLLQ